MHTIVVGGGIAGLTVALALANKGDRVTLLEKDERLGGRIVTSKYGYEIGAGRLHNTHNRICQLVTHYGLKTFPISTRSGWRPLGSNTETNRFNETWAAITKQLRRLPASELSAKPLRDLASATFGPHTSALLTQFPYRAETEILRADLALRSFDDEMGTHNGFNVVAGGLQGVIKGLAADARKAGVRIRTETPVKDVKQGQVILQSGKTLEADRIVLALPISALRSFSALCGLPLLHHLEMSPLTRIYAQYPVKPCWFAGEPHTVSNSPLRYIIPISEEKGIIMISYTEGRDTVHFRGLQGAALTEAIQYEVRRLYPDREIPEPLWVRSYEWTDGCSYWKPGAYDPFEASKEALEPIPGIHLCGESFSTRQAWIEGALEHAELLLTYLNHSRKSA
jgi:monoamine oxidase